MAGAGAVIGAAAIGVGSALLTDTSSGGEAALAQARGNRKGIDELSRQFDITQSNLNPFIQAGQGALPDVIEGSTIGGLDERLRQIFDSDIFSSLVDERTRAVEGRNAATGNFRSGAGLLDAARVPTDVGLFLENQLSNRGTNLAGSGQNAAGGLGAIGAENSANIANLFSNTGSALSAGILTDAQATTARNQGLLNSASSLIGGFFG